MIKKDAETAENNTLVGIPTMAFLPPKNFYFRVKEDTHKITVPKSGTFYELDNDFFNKEDGEFVIINEEKTVVNISVITKILFGMNKYPDLKDNQLFCPISLSINSTTVDIFGQVVEMLEAPEGLTVDKQQG